MRDASGFPSARNDQIRIVLGLILVNPEWRWFFKRQFFSFPKMKSYLDTNLRVVHVVPIAGEDI